MTYKKPEMISIKLKRYAARSQALAEDYEKLESSVIRLKELVDDSLILNNIESLVAEFKQFQDFAKTYHEKKEFWEK